jgi:hypothetical protein
MEDFWGLVLYPWLYSLTELNLLKLGQIPSVNDQVGRDNKPRKNDQARPALELLRPFTEAELKKDKARRYVPFGIPAMTDNIAGMLSDDIRTGITSNPQALGGQTMWHLVLGFAGRYLFAIIPQGARATAAPLVPGLREYWKTIEREDYVFKAVTTETPQVLRAVGVMSGMAMPGNSSGKASDYTDKVFRGVAGWFEPREAGMVELVDAPPWVNQSVLGSRFAAAAAGVKGADNAAKPAEKQTVATAVQPGAADPPVPAPADTAKENATKLQNFCDAYARYVFAIRGLETRQGRLSGPLRFDIAPGSTVRIAGLNDDYLGQGNLWEYFFATVLQVTVSIDCEAGTAGTAFHLAYIRDATENQEDATSVENHPLYNKVFTGCVLATEPSADDSQFAIFNTHITRARNGVDNNNPTRPPPPAPPARPPEPISQVG